VPLDKDGVPVLTADWSEQQSVTDTLHNVDHVIVDNQAMVKDALLSFESYTATLKSKGEAIDSALARADTAFANFGSVIDKIDGALPGLADGEDGALFQKVKSIRELADSFKKRSAVFLEDGRRTLLDVSEAANAMDHKLNPAAAPAPPRRPQPQQKRP
jgi:phospholipid/cholesterol/gamma-HCH transport system substrate-binding protein